MLSAANEPLEKIRPDLALPCAIEVRNVISPMHDTRRPIGNKSHGKRNE